MTTPGNFFHPKPEHFAEIAQRFSSYTCYNYPLLQREVPMPALLSYAGYPVAANQFCFRHKGDGTSLSIYMHRDGFWYFYCCSPECGIKGDVTEMWYQMVLLSGFAPEGWNRPRAAGDLLARGIETNLTELSKSAGRPSSPQSSRSKDVYFAKLQELIKRERRGVLPEATLPSRPVKLSACTKHFGDCIRRTGSSC